MKTPSFGRWQRLAAPVLAACLAASPAAAATSDAGRFSAIEGALDTSAVARWALASTDPGGLPFVVVDKLAAKVSAFDSAGRLIAETPALLGAARGDVSPAGIGTMRLADIAPTQRITPAGRFKAHLGKNLAGHSILWVDYDAALSLHAVATGKAAERRLERLVTATILDNRISFGCINVPADFYQQIIKPLFESYGGIVYILPESPVTSTQIVTSRADPD